jgi:ribosomal protein S18 acetylase RimI-like enzyme
MQYRWAKDSDLEEITVLVNSAYRGDSSKIGWTTEADLLGGQRTDPESLRELIQNKQSGILLGIQNEKIQACVYLATLEFAGYLGMLTVNPKLQNAGIGKALMSEAESRVKSDWHCSSMRMTVISVRQELIAYYERRGYILTGESEAFPYGDEKFGLPKRQDLEFVVMIKQL